MFPSKNLMQRKSNCFWAPTKKNTVRAQKAMPGNEIICHCTFQKSRAGNWLLETLPEMKELFQSKNQHAISAHPCHALKKSTWGNSRFLLKDPFYVF